MSLTNGNGGDRDPIEEVVERAADKLACQAATQLPQVQRAYWLTRTCIIQTIAIAVLVVITGLNLLRLGDVRQSAERTQDMMRCAVAVSANPELASNPLRLAECLK